MLRSGVVGTLALAVVLGAGVPALAVPELEVDPDPANFTMAPGESKSVTVRLTAGNADENNVDLTVEAPGGNLSGEVFVNSNDPACQRVGTSAVTCQNMKIAAGQNKRISFAFSAKAQTGLQPGETRQGAGSVRLAFGRSKDVNITLKAPAQAPTQAQTVTEVSGTVVDLATNAPLGNALVILQDSARHEYQTNANAQGRYVFTGSNEKPISPGAITLGASKEGFENGTVTKEGQAGKALTGLRIQLKQVASAAPSAEAPAAAAPSASTADLPGQSNTSKKSGGPSALSWLFIGIGVLLVLLGIGAMIVLLIRRKGPDDLGPEGEDGRPTRVAGGAAVPGAGGRYGGGAAERTAVARTGAAGSNDATAIVHSGPPQLDEYPDPYAAPLPQPQPTRVGYQGGADAGYGGADPGYGGADPGYGGGPAYNGGYGGDRGYGGGRGYDDEPRTNRYGSAEPYGRHGAEGPTQIRHEEMPPRARYEDEPPRARYSEEPRGRYGGGEPEERPGGGYPTAGNYPGAGPNGGGYGARGGHGDEYERPRAGGYDAGGGYERGREPRGGYSDGGYGGDGYNDDRRGAPPPARGRQVNWLDD